MILDRVMHSSVSLSHEPKHSRGVLGRIVFVDHVASLMVVLTVLNNRVLIEELGLLENGLCIQ